MLQVWIKKKEKETIAKGKKADHKEKERTCYTKGTGADEVRGK